MGSVPASHLPRGGIKVSIGQCIEPRPAQYRGDNCLDFANGDLDVLDRGGTFTDVVVMYPDGSEKVFKLLSRDPSNYQDAPIEAVRRIVQEATGTEIPRGQLLDLTCIG